jgi:hypothetical protein
MNKRFASWNLSLCLLAGFALGAGNAQANAPAILDRGSVEFGLSTSELDGTVAVNGNVVGTDIDVSRDLNIGGRDRGEVLAARWRPFDRHEFGVRAQRYGRSGERTISRDIVFDDEVFTINSRLKGDLDLDVWTLNYTGWVIANEQRALGISVGALQYRLGLKLVARNLPGGVQPEPLEAEASEDLPVWVFGAEYREQLSQRWRVVLRGSAFKASINRIDGTVYSFDAGVEYAFTEQLALALRYSEVLLEAEASRAELTGRLDLDLSSIQSALIWRW